MGRENRSVYIIVTVIITGVGRNTMACIVHARVLCDTRVIQVAGTRPDGAPARETKETCVRLVITQLPSTSTQGDFIFPTAVHTYAHSGDFAIALYVTRTVPYTIALVAIN